jgi:hypothetical protein
MTALVLHRERLAWVIVRSTYYDGHPADLTEEEA